MSECFSKPFLWTGGLINPKGVWPFAVDSYRADEPTTRALLSLELYTHVYKYKPLCPQALCKSKVKLRQEVSLYLDVPLICH